VQQALEELRRYRSVVVDNTNPGKDTRKLYAELGIQRNIPVRVVWFTASEELCVHNNGVRASLDPARKSLPMTAWATYRGNFQEPTVAEGVEQVLRVDFRPDFGGDEKLKERWFMFQADPPKQW
jgi:bifunctional polynucleotide phosphatase/kinase